MKIEELIDMTSLLEVEDPVEVKEVVEDSQKDELTTLIPIDIEETDPPKSDEKKEEDKKKEEISLIKPEEVTSIVENVNLDDTNLTNAPYSDEYKESIKEGTSDDNYNEQGEYIVTDDDEHGEETETTDRISTRRQSRGEEIVNQTTELLSTMPDKGGEGYTKQEWYRFFRKDPGMQALKKDKEGGGEDLYNYLTDAIKYSRESKGATELQTKEDFLDLLSSKTQTVSRRQDGKVQKEDMMFDLGRRNLMDPYIDINEASEPLQRDLNKIAEKLFEGNPTQLGDKINIETGEVITDEDIENGVPWKYQNVVGYDINREATETTTGVNVGYDEGYQYDEVTGKRLYNPNTGTETAYGQSGDIVDLYYLDENGKKQRKQGYKSDSYKGGELEVINPTEMLADIPVYTSTDNMIGHFDKKIDKLKNKLDNSDLSEERRTTINEKINFFENLRTKARQVGADASATFAVTMANDKEGIFHASKSDYFDKDSQGKIIYDSFSPGNAFQKAIKFTGLKNFNGFFNPTKTDVGSNGTEEQQAEINFNNSVFRGFGFYLEGGRLYSGIEFSEYGIDNAREQIKAKDGGVEGVDYIDFKFGVDDKILNGAQGNKLKFFLEHQVERGADGKPKWDHSNEQVLENNLADRVADETRAYQVIKERAATLLEEIEGEYGTKNIFKGYKTAMDNVNVFETKLEKAGSKLLPIKSELDIDVKNLNEQYSTLNTEIDAISKIDIELEKEATRINEMEDGAERNKAIEELRSKEKDRNQTAGELRKTRDRLEKDNKKYKNKKSRYERKLKNSKYAELQTDLYTPINLLAKERDPITGKPITDDWGGEMSTIKVTTEKGSIVGGGEAQFYTFKLPSGEKLKIEAQFLGGLGMDIKGSSGIVGVTGNDRRIFNENIKMLGITKENIDYDPNLTNEEEWNRLQSHGFSPQQIMEVYEASLQERGGELLEQSEKMQVYNRLMVDKAYHLNSANEALIKKQDLRTRAQDYDDKSFGSVTGAQAALYDEINEDAEARGLTVGELGQWTLGRLGENVMGALGGSLQLFLRGTQVIGGATGFYSKSEMKQIDRTLAQTDRDIQSVTDFIKPDINSEVDANFSNSFIGQVYGTFIDMVFDIAIMKGTGGAGLGTSRKAIKAAFKSGTALAKTKGGMKEFMKWGLGLNPTMALRTYQQNERFFHENPEWQNASASEKMLYSAGTAFIIGKLDKLGIEATMMKGGGELVQGILGKVLRTAKPGDDLAKLTNQEIKRLLAQTVIKVGGGQAGEVTTEVLQSVFEWGAQDLMNAIQGFDGEVEGTGFVNPDWGSPEMAEELWDIAKVAAVASAPISIGTAAYETYKTNNKYNKIKILSELGDTQFDLTYQAYTPDMMNMRRKYLSDKVQDPDIEFTKEDAEKELKFHQEVADIMQQIPGDLRPDLKRKAYDNLTTIKDLKEEIYKKDDQGNLTSTLKIDKNLAEDKLNQIKALEESLTKLGEEVTEDGTITGDAKVKKDYTYDPLADMENVVNLAAEEDVDIIVAKTREEAEALAEEHNVKLVDEEGNITNAAITENGKTIIVDESTSKLTEEGRQAVKHDFFHKFLQKTLTKEGNENLVFAMGTAIDEELGKLNTEDIADSEFKKRVELYNADPAKVTAEEKLTLLSDALSTGDIVLKETVGTKLGDFFRRLFQSLGVDITLKNSKDVINFVKDYNKSIGKGKFTKAQQKAMRKGADADVSLLSQGEAIAEAEAEVEAETEVEAEVTTDEDAVVEEKTYDNVALKMYDNTWDNLSKFEQTEVVDAVEGNRPLSEIKKVIPEDKSKKSKTKKFTPKQSEEVKKVLQEKVEEKKAKLDLQKSLLEEKEGGYKSKIKENAPAIKALTTEISNLEDITTIRTGEGQVGKAKNRLIDNTEGIRTKIAKSIAENPKYFAGIAPEAATQGMGVSTLGQAKKMYIDSLKNNLGVMIANEWDPTIEPDLEKFTRNRGFVRAKSLATELGVADTRKVEGGIGITKDLSTALGVGTDEDIEGNIDKRETEQAYMLKDKLPNAEKLYKNLKELGKDIDADSKTYKDTPKLALDQTVGMFMSDPDAVYQKGKVKGQNIKDSIVKKILENKTLNKQDLEVLTPYLEQEILNEEGEVVALVADLLQDAMPDGTTPSGKSTGVQNSLLGSDLYKKGKRVTQKKTGSAQGNPVQVKQKLPTAKFIDIFSKGEEMKALITQTDRILTNQAIRDSQNKPASKMGEGRGEKMYSKADVKAILTEVADVKNIKKALKVLKIGSVSINEGNRKAQQKTIEKAFKDHKLDLNVFLAGSFNASGAMNTRKQNGDVYYNLTNGEEIKGIPVLHKDGDLKGEQKYNNKGKKMFLQPTLKMIQDEHGKGVTLVAAKGRLYYGASDPAYIKAKEIATKNSSPEVIKNTAKKINPPVTGITDQFIKDNKKKSDNNMEILNSVAKQLEKAFSKGMPIENAALIITQGYQATNGLIKIAAPFKYRSKIFEHAYVGKQSDTEGKKYREEHNPPASVVGASLIAAIQTKSVDMVMKGIKDNYFQVQLSKQDDTRIDIAGLASTLPEGHSIVDNSAIRLIDSGINLNSIINPITGKSMAEELGAGVDPKFQDDPNVVSLQNDLLKQKLEGIDVNIKGQLKAFLPIASAKTKAGKKMAKEIAGSEVVDGRRYSKTNSNEVIRELGILDKALQIAVDPNAPAKKIRVFDFDDTLARTKSNVFYTMPNGRMGQLTAEEFAKKGTELKNRGAEFDFSDFNRVVDGKKGPLFKVAEMISDKRGTQDMFVLTARSPEAAPAIKEFLDALGLEIPIENITGLGDSSPLAKSGWMVEKAADGYNDFYFADDHLGNVDAVKKVLEVVDVKSKVQQAKIRFSKTAGDIFNNIIEQKTGIEAHKVFSDAKAKVRGRSKGKFKFFIPPSAEDFEGLLYKTLGKGKLGNDQKAWYKEVLFDPFAKAMNNMAADERGLIADFKAIKKILKDGGIPKNLNKKAFDSYTYSDIARILAWDQQGIKIDGLSDTDLKKIKQFANKNPAIDVFAKQLVDINKGSGYKYPGSDWLVGTITTDLMDGLNTTKRSEYLAEWQANVDLIFTKENLNKLEAAFGSKYREAIENSLYRMKTGKNRSGKGNRIENQLLEYLNNSVGAVMFFNMRSAALQTLSTVNFANWSFNNPAKMAKAFANQPQYWKDFMELMNSDFLVTRRKGLRINVSESEIADAAATGTNKAKGAINYILRKGFLPTQFADSFAIASGGATFYRNRINDLMKNEKMSEADAKVKAYEEFREISEASQQSSRPDKISQQQASGIGRVILAFANTPSQYARIIKKSTLDLVNGRGDWRHNMSKILYYGFAQNLIFNALQQAIFAWGWDEDEDDEEKELNIANGMLDSLLRGLGWGGALVSALKNVGIDAYGRLTDEDPGFRGMELWKSGLKFLDFAPPIDVKISKLMRAGSNWEFNAWRPEASNPFDIDNPAYKSIALVVAATTNVPVDRLFQKQENVRAAFEKEQENWKRIALLFGYPEWQLESSKERQDRQDEEKEQKRDRKAQDDLSLYNKAEQEDILRQHGLDEEQLANLKNETERVEAIKYLNNKFNVNPTPSEKVRNEIKKAKEEKKKQNEKEEVKETEAKEKVKEVVNKPLKKVSFTNPTPKKRNKIKAADRTKSQTRLYKLNKASQIDTLKSLGMSNSQIEKLRYEEDRVRKIEELYENR